MALDDRLYDVIEFHSAIGIQIYRFQECHTPRSLVNEAQRSIDNSHAKNSEMNCGGRNNP